MVISLQDPSVFIIVLNWNNYQDTAECLSSLNDLTYRNYQVVVVDNGSTDDSPYQLQKEFPTVHTIINPDNLGFAAGCNVGIKYALKQGADAVLLVNNDAILEPESLEAAVQSLFSDGRIGIVGGKLKQYYNPSYISTTGVRRIIWPIMIWRSVGNGQLDKGQYDRREKRVAVIGALMLIKREVFKAIGLLPEEYFFGCEDIDFCLQALKNGFHIIYEPRFVAYHKGGGRLRKSPQYVYSYFLHRQVLMKRHLHPLFQGIGRGLFVLYAKYYWFNRHCKRGGIDNNVQEIKKALWLALDKGRFLSRVDKAYLKGWDIEMRPSSGIDSEF